MSKVDCKGKVEVDSCIGLNKDNRNNENCDNFYDKDKKVCKNHPTDDNDCVPDDDKKCERERRGGSGNTSVAGLEEYETMRIIVTYLVVFFMIMALVATSDSKDSLMMMMLFTVLYLVVCGLFDYFWMKNYLIENRTTGDTSGRDTFHKILHMILPGIVIIFGYSFLLSGFNTILDASNMKSLMLFMIKLISLVVIIVGYLYYTIKLKNVVDDTSRNNNNKNTQIDILYSILHPVAILLISGAFYMLILFTINRKRMVVSAPPVQQVSNPLAT
jgi:hypothetical protein